MKVSHDKATSERLCPFKFGRHAVIRDAPGWWYQSKEAEAADTNLCEGQKCMAWRWVEKPPPTTPHEIAVAHGYCGLAKLAVG